MIKKILVMLLAFSFVTGCVTIRKFDNWQIRKSHKWAYHDSVDVIDSAIPSKVSKQCGIIFNAPIPPTIRAVTKEEMASLLPIYTQSRL